MITLTAKINILSGNGSLDYAYSDIQGNNISSDLSALLGVKRRVENPFIIGVSKLGDGSTFSGQVNYFIGSELSNENGIFSSPYEIVISGWGITAFTIAFDDKNNRHPSSIVVDGETFVDDDPLFTVKTTEAGDHTIIIDNWNTPNSPLIITGIYVDITIDVDRTNLVSMEREIKDRAASTIPSFGLVSNGGKMSFIDSTGEIKDYAEMQLLTSGLNVTIYLNNTLKNIRQEIGLYKTTEWSYDNYNKQVSVSFGDGLEDWQNIIIPAIDFTPSNLDGTSASSVYEDLYDITRGYGGEVKQLINLDVETRNLIYSLRFPFKTREGGSLWSAWQKFCEATQCHMYVQDGQVILKYNGGN